MALKIRAMKSNLGTSKRAWFAQASWSRLVDSEAFINRMAAARTTISKTEILAVFQLAREELCSLLAEGCYVKTPLGAVLPVAGGSFGSPDEPFRPNSPDSGHRLRFDFRIDPDIEDAALAQVACVREKPEDRMAPRIGEVRFLPEGEPPRAGGIVRASGLRLKFDNLDERLGLFFRSSSGREWRAPSCVEIRPSSVIAIVPPDLPAGDYRVVVRTRSRGAAIMEGTADSPFHVHGAAPSFESLLSLCATA
jgi:hypothetical protein